MRFKINKMKIMTIMDEPHTNPIYKMNDEYRPSPHNIPTLVM